MADLQPPVFLRTQTTTSQVTLPDNSHELILPLNPVELPCRPRIRFRPLTPHRQMHGMPPPHITPNQPMMRNVLPHIPLQLSFNLQTLQRVQLLSILLSL